MYSICVIVSWRESGILEQRGQQQELSLTLTVLLVSAEVDTQQFTAVWGHIRRPDLPAWGVHFTLFMNNTGA